MPAEVVNSTSTGTVAGTSISISTPTGGGADDVLIAIVELADNVLLSGISAPSGWVLVGDTLSTSSHPRTRVYRLTLTGTPSGSYNFTKPSGQACGIMLLVRGADLTQIIDVGISSANTQSTSQPAPSVTTQTADALRISFYGSNPYAQSGSLYLSAAAGEDGSRIASGTTFTTAMASWDRIASAGSTGTRTATFTNTDLTGVMGAFAIRSGEDTATTQPNALVSTTVISQPLLIPTHTPFVIGATREEAALVSSKVVNTPVGTQINDVIIAVVSADSGGSAASQALPAGFNEWDEDDTSQQPQTTVGFLILASTPASSYTFTTDPSAIGQCTLITIRHFNTDSPFLTVPTIVGQDQPASASHILPSIAGTGVGLLLGFYFRDNGGTISSGYSAAPSGMTLIPNTDSGRTFHSQAVYKEQIVTSGESGTKTATHGSSSSSVRGEAGFLMSVNPIGSAGITLSNLEVEIEIQQPNIIQHHLLAAQNMVVETEMSPAFFFTTHNVSVLSVETETIISQPVLSDQYILIFTQSLEVETIVSTPSFSQLHIVAPQSLIVETSLSEPSLLTIGTIYGQLLFIDYEERQLFVESEPRLEYVDNEERRIILDI